MPTEVTTEISIIDAAKQREVLRRNVTVDVHRELHPAMTKHRRNDLRMRT